MRVREEYERFMKESNLTNLDLLLGFLSPGIIVELFYRLFVSGAADATDSPSVSILDRLALPWALLKWFNLNQNEIILVGPSLTFLTLFVISYLALEYSGKRKPLGALFARRAAVAAPDWKKIPTWVVWPSMIVICVPLALLALFTQMKAGNDINARVGGYSGLEPVFIIVVLTPIIAIALLHSLFGFLLGYLTGPNPIEIKTDDYFQGKRFPTTGSAVLGTALFVGTLYVAGWAVGNQVSWTSGVVFGVLLFAAVLNFGLRLVWLDYRAPLFFILGVTGLICVSSVQELL